jgi:hypothetical protein
VFTFPLHESPAQNIMFPYSFTLDKMTPLSYDLTYLHAPDGIPNRLGSYSLVVNITGPTSAQVLYPLGSDFTVKGFEEFSPGPLIKRAVFSSDGSKILVEFDGRTNGLSSKSLSNCSQLFRFTTSSTLSLSPFLSSTRCLWLSDESLEMYSVSSLNVGDVIELKKRVLKARCTSLTDPLCVSWPFSVSHNITISIDLDLLSPVAVNLNLPNVLGACDDLLLDLSSSLGSGGRDWKSITFMVSNAPLQRYLSNLVSSYSFSWSLSLPISIPNNLFHRGASYSLTVELCNFLGVCGQTSRSFVISSSSEVPIVSFRSSSLISTSRNRSLLISADAFVSLCGEGSMKTKLTSSLRYEWSVRLGTELQNSSSFRSVSLNPMQFKLPPYQLRSNSVYVVQLRVTHLISSKSSSNSVEVKVNPGSLVCLCSSFSSPSLPSSSTIFAGSDVEMRLTDSLLLDLSRSYDEDVYTGLSSSSTTHGMLFDWSCFRVSPTFRSSCTQLLVISFVSSSTSQISISLNSSSLDGVKEGDRFSFSIRGRTSNSEDSRSCQTSFVLVVLASESPLLKLSVVRSALPSSEAVKINPSSKLKAIGTVDLRSSGEVYWSLSDPSIDLSLMQSPLSRILSPSSHMLSFVMPENFLADALAAVSGSPFAFTLSLNFKSGDGRVSSTSISIKINSPPSLCQFEVSPRVGVILKTTFLMSSSRCVDEDLPLSYQFGYSSLSDDNNMVVLRSKLELSHTSTLLPLGSAESNFYLSCLTHVFDNLDADRVIFADVVVGKNENQSIRVKDYLLEGLNQAHRDPDTLKNVVSLTTSVLNMVNCSLSPVSYCMSLNRKRCGMLTNTCGECVSGHVGLSGPSNTPCLSLSDTRRGLMSHNRMQSSPSGADVHCVSDGDCESGLFLECRAESHLCGPIQQSCPNSCSGHGRCVFRSKYHRNVTVEECGVLDVTCAPVCECMEGYMGSSCSRVKSDYLSDLEIRRLLLEAISEMMSLENPDRSSVRSWLVMLRSLATDYSSLDADSKVLLGKMCESLLLASLEVSLSPGDLPGLENVIDQIFSIMLSPPQNRTQVADVVHLLNSLVNLYSRVTTGDMLEGQDAVEVVVPLFRMSSHSLSAPSSSQLFSPLSHLESLSDQTLSNSASSFVRKRQSIHLPSSLLSPTHISLVDTENFNAIGPQDDLNSTELSNSFGGVLAGFVCNPQESDCLFQIELVNHLHRDDQDLSSTEEEYFESECILGTLQDHSFTCSTGHKLILECDGTKSGMIRRSCPVVTSSAICKSTTPSEGLSPMSCVLVAFDSRTTICNCNLTSQNDAEPIQFSVQSIGHSVINEFDSTWGSVGSLSVSDVRKSVAVLVTVSLIGAFFLLMAGVGMQWDASDRKSSEAESILCATHTKILKSSNRSSRMTSSSRNPHSSHQNLIDKSLPSVFQTESLWNKFNRELKVYHRWLGIVFYYSPEFPRSMRVMSLFSSLVIMLFVQSVTYNIADPDDGSCEDCDDENCCLSLRSTLNVNEDRCSWESQPDATTGSCYFRPISGDMERVFVVAILSAIISAPLSLAVQYLITNILSLETSEWSAAVSVSDEMTVGHRKRVLSEHNSSSLRECCGNNFFDDLKNLVEEVSNYGSHLQGEKLKQYTDSWGLLLEPSFQRSPQNKKDVLVARSSKLLSRLASQDSTHSIVQQNLAKELAAVRREVFEEYHWFKEGADRVYANKDACLEAKRLRLLYLFVKDLSSGVSGEVLSKKARRDGVAKRIGDVSWKWKFLGWLFVILMNLGMLLYVYLFALRQTKSRQLAWVQSFVVWLIFDLFIAGTGVVLVTHLLIPLYVMSDIRTIKKKVLGDVVAFQDRLKQRSQPQPPVGTVVGISDIGNELGSSPNHDDEFNSAKYLFASWRVAWLCREIPESQLILQFSTPWPKQSLKREKKKVTQTYERRYSFIGQALSRVLIFFLTSLIHLPLMLQDLLIHFVSNSGLGYLILLILRLARIHPVLPVLAILMLGVVVHFLVKVSYSSPPELVSSSVSPVTPSQLDNERDPTPEAKSLTPQTEESALHQPSPPSLSSAPVPDSSKIDADDVDEEKGLSSVEWESDENEDEEISDDSSGSAISSSDSSDFNISIRIVPASDESSRSPVVLPR